MNKLLTLGCVAAVFTAISCQKEADRAHTTPATGKLVPVTVEATVPETRVTLSAGGNLPAWREAGKVVIGMGERKTPETFRVSCERFIFLDILESDDNIPVKKAASKKAAAGRRVRKTADPVEETTADLDGEAENAFTDIDTIEEAIIKMIIDNSAEGKETGLGEIGSRLVKIFPDFDIRNYHYSKLSEFLMDFPSLTVENRDNAVWVSLAASSDSEIESQILKIFENRRTNDMYLSALKKELEKVNPNLDAAIRKSGVTRFSVYLNRNIKSLEVSGRYARLRNPIY